jgi:hypothetical protein
MAACAEVAPAFVTRLPMTVNVPPVRDVKHKHDAQLLVDAIDDPIRPSPGAMTTAERTEQRLTDPLRVLGERTYTELENRRRNRLG